MRLPALPNFDQSIRLSDWHGGPQTLSMLSTVHSGALMGIEAWPITVEVNTGEVGNLRLW